MWKYWGTTASIRHGKNFKNNLWLKKNWKNYELFTAWTTVLDKRNVRDKSRKLIQELKTIPLLYLVPELKTISCSRNVRTIISLIMWFFYAHYRMHDAKLRNHFKQIIGQPCSNCLCTRGIKRIATHWFKCFDEGTTV